MASSAAVKAPKHPPPRVIATVAHVVEILDAARRARVPVWLYGGWGMEALGYHKLPPHEDIDLTARAVDEKRLHALMGKLGYRVWDSPESRLRFMRGKIGVDVFFFETQADGVAVTRGGGHCVFAWPRGAFPARANGWLGKQRCRVVNMATQYVMRAGYQLMVPGSTARPKDAVYLDAIKRALPATAQRQCDVLFDALAQPRRTG